MPGEPTEPVTAGTPSSAPPAAGELAGENRGDGAEHVGPLELERLHKADGRSLILYSVSDRAGA